MSSVDLDASHISNLSVEEVAPLDSSSCASDDEQPPAASRGPAVGSKRRRVAWQDADDEEEWELDAQRRAIEAFGSAPQLAAPADAPADPEDAVLRRAGRLVLDGAAPRLPERRLDFRRVADANRDSASSQRLTAVEFHPHAPVLLTGSTDARVCLFQADGHVNQLLHSLYLERFPIMSARFLPDGAQAVLCSRTRGFRMLDLASGHSTLVPKLRGLPGDVKLSQVEVAPAGTGAGAELAFLGQEGAVHLVDPRSCQRVATLHVSGQVHAVAFRPGGRQLLAAGSEGLVSCFDLRRAHGRFLSRFADEAATCSLSLAASANGQFVAVGDRTGVVNLYPADVCAGAVAAPVPQRRLLNLRTGVDTLRFNPSAELLLMSSSREPAALRLLHLDSLTVMANFPGRGVAAKQQSAAAESKLGHVTVANFSPQQGGFLALGQNSGRAALFRLNQYPKY